MKKKSIAIDASGEKNWIGGLYYKKNIIFSIIQNENILSEYEIIILTNQENEYLFADFRDKAKIVLLPSYNKRLDKLLKLLVLFRYRCRYIFPYYGESFYKYFGIEEIYWIPDFQECYYPEFFSKELIDLRKGISERLVKSKDLLVLSSQNAYDDLTRFFGKKNEVAIVNFVSYIEKEINGIGKAYENEILKKYQIEKDKYVCICNQFWQHKNHLVVLKMIKKLVGKYPDNKLNFVFTGELKDYRNKNYFNLLQNLFNDADVSSRCKMLGFIDRKEQIVLIKNAKCVIQPSLFEGWGTVLEDAKVLDKMVLLSDIPVHREQKNNNCVLFNPHDPEELLEGLIKVNSMTHKDDISKGLDRMYKDAAEYSKKFETLIKI